MLDTERQIEYAKWVLERNLGWIAQAEVKVAVLITLNLAISGALAAAFTSNEVHLSWAKALTGLAALCLFGGVVCAAMTVKPNTKNPKKSFVFFARIIDGRSRNEFISAFNQADEYALLEDLIDQIYRNAEIATAKHKWVKRGINLSLLGAGVTVPAVLSLIKI